MITSYLPKVGKTTYSKLLSEELNNFILVDGDFYKPEKMKIPNEKIVKRKKLKPTGVKLYSRLPTVAGYFYVFSIANGNIL